MTAPVSSSGPDDARPHVRAHVFVRGRVQGVWFRESCRDRAVRAAVDGWVRNLDDGRVEAVFEGPVAAVEAMVAWCREGPARARVDRVEESRGAPIGESRFRVR